MERYYDDDHDNIVELFCSSTISKTTEQQVQLLAMCTTLLLLAEEMVAREMRRPGSKRQKRKSLRALNIMQKSYHAMILSIAATATATATGTSTTTPTSHYKDQALKMAVSNTDVVKVKSSLFSEKTIHEMNSRSSLPLLLLLLQHTEINSFILQSHDVLDLKRVKAASRWDVPSIILTTSNSNDDISIVTTPNF
jgi:histone H3/H4